MRYFASILIALCLWFPAAAQYADGGVERKSSDFQATQLIAPGALLVAGTVLHFASHDGFDVGINNQTSRWLGSNAPQKVDDWLRFLPEAMHLGLGLAGAQSEHNFRDHAIEAVWAFGSYAVIGYTLKAVVDSPRPDMSDNRSFPSGHAGVAFMGAELVRMEYGWGWGAGAYAVATGVSALRLYNNEHWMSDLLFGAGAGILCAHIGGWLLEPTKRLLGIDSNNVSLATTMDPVSGAVCPMIAFRF